MDYATRDLPSINPGARERGTSAHSSTRCSCLGALFQEVVPEPGFPARPTVTSHVQVS